MKALIRNEAAMAEKTWLIAAMAILSGKWIFLDSSGGLPGGAVLDYLSQAAVYGLMALFIVRNRRLIRQALFAEAGFLAVLALLFLSLLWTLDWKSTLLYSVVMTCATFLGMYLGARFDPEEQLELLWKALAVCAVLSPVFVLILPKYGIMWDIQNVGSWKGIYVHKNMLGRAMALGAAVFFLLFLARKSRRKWYGALFLLSLLLLVLSKSKTSLVVLAVLLPLIPVLRVLGKKGVSGSGARLLLFSIPLALLAAWFFREPILDLLGKKMTLTGRTEVWAAIWDDLTRNPWLGYGYRGFWSDAGLGAEVRKQVGWNVQDSHNGFIDAALDLGVIGLALILWLLLKSAVRAVKWLRTENTLLSVWPLLFLVFMVVSNITESAVLKNNLIWVLFVSLTVSMTLRKSGERHEQVSAGAGPESLEQTAASAEPDTFSGHEEPMVSVVIPTRGRPHLLKRALDSVFSQTYPRFEVIVVVDGPDDETENVLKTFQDGRLRVVVNPQPLGGAEARNEGVRHARGEWIAFLDDDDEWLPNKLEVQLRAVRKSSFRWPVAFCRLIGRAPHGDYIWPRRPLRENEPISEYLMARDSLFQGEGLIVTTMIFAPRGLLLEIPFTKGLRRHQEWDWLIRVSHHPGVGFVFCEDVLAVWYVEEKRSGISKQGNWSWSAEWIRGHRERVTPRAYASFLMVLVSSIAKKDGDRRAFFRILKEAVTHGKPKPIDFLLFLGIWGTPQRLRWWLRSLLQGTGRDALPIVQVVTQMEGGGAQRVAVLLAEEFRKKGIPNELWFLYTKRDIYRSLPDVHSFLPHPPGGWTDIFRILWRMVRRLAKTRPETVISHTYYSNVLVQPFAWLLGARSRIAVQHSPVETYPKLARMLDRRLGEIGIYTDVVAVSQAVYDYLLRYKPSYVSRLKVIPNGIPQFEPSRSRPEMRRLLSIPSEAPLLVNVGRLSEPKNQELLIRILPDLPGAHLVIVGEGELREPLMALTEEMQVGDRVHFVGEVPPEEVVNYLNAADLFVFPSLYEAMGMAMLEAMTRGLPIVASDLPSIREVTELEEGGYAAVLVPSGDQAGFVRAIRSLLEDRERSLRLGELARRKSGIYRVSKMADAYEQLRGENHEGSFSGDRGGRLHHGCTPLPDR